MTLNIDYYFAPQSPWAYLGHARFAKMAAAAGASVRVLPVDLGKVFPVSGGLPLGKRAPQRQAYRLLELKRFSDWLQLPMHVQPRHFPVAGDDAARLIVAVDQAEGATAAMRLAGAVMAAVWAEQRDVANASTLAALLHENGLAASLLQASREATANDAYEAHSQQAIDRGVFGSPTYVVDGEMFWGQDRLDFVREQLSLEQA